MKNSLLIPTHSIVSKLISLTDVTYEKSKNVIDFEIGLVRNFKSRMFINLNDSSPPNNTLSMSIYEIIIFIICFDYYYNNQDEKDNNGFLFISVDTINKYRNIKRSNPALASRYKSAFHYLSYKRVNISLGNLPEKYLKRLNLHSITGSIISYKAIKKNEKLIGFKYKFSPIYDFIVSLKQITFMPKELLQIRPNQITELLIAFFLEYYLRINYRKEKFSLKLRTLMKDIPYFKEKMEISKVNIYQKIISKDSSSYKVLKRFAHSLKKVLEVLKSKDNKLVDYKIPDLSIKNFYESDCTLEFYLKKKSDNPNKKSKNIETK